MIKWDEIWKWIQENYECEYDEDRDWFEVFYDLEDQIRSVYLRHMTFDDLPQEYVQIFAPIGELSDNDIFDLLADWSGYIRGALIRLRRSDCIYFSFVVPLRDGVESTISTLVPAFAQESARLEEKYLGTDAKCLHPKKFKLSEDLVLINGGDMGSFYISKYEVTQELYQSVTGVNPNIFCYDVNVGTQRPVTNVSWYDAIRFCNMLSKKEGKTPVYSVNGKTDVDDWNYTAHTTGKKIDGEVKMNIKANGYRLPTVAEWKFAAAGGENYTYSGSDDIDEVAWYEGNSGDETHKVGRKKANRYGLYDMSGNVSEWCWDVYSNPIYKSKFDQRCCNCGSSYSDASLCEVDAMLFFPDSGRMPDKGFRVVCSK